MELLKRAFNEVGSAYEQTFANYKNLKNLLLTISLLLILPFVLITAISTSLGFFERLMQSSLFVSVAIILFIMIVFLCIVYAASLAIGFLANAEKVSKTENYSLSALSEDGIKKIIPSLALGIYVSLPLVASVAFTLVFVEYFGYVGLISGAVLIIVSIIWAILTYFGKFFLVIDDVSIEGSIFKSIPLVAKNIADLVIRFIVFVISVAIPAAIVSSIINGIGLQIIKSYYHFPTLEIAHKYATIGMLPPFGQWIDTIFSSLDSVFSIMIVMPITIFYIFNLFDHLKKHTQNEDKSKNERGVVWLFLLTAIMSLAVFVKVVF